MMHDPDMDRPPSEFELARRLSPRRKTTSSHDIQGLVREQLEHFSIDPHSPIGRALAPLAEHIYSANVDLRRLWEISSRTIQKLPLKDRIAAFNAKRFLCFQLAKMLDNLQNPLRKSYQSVVTRQSTHAAKGAYPLFDNVTAIFSANPVITRTATYIYACTEWIDDAFQGKELLHEIYSRLMNPTSICLANHIVDIEAGPMAGEYFAWNFNSGMAAIDAILSHLLGYEDIVLSNRNIYGGSYQLLHDWFGKAANLHVAVEWFDGATAEAFASALKRVQKRYSERVKAARHIYVYLESPCNPHGYVLDVPAICRIAHAQDIAVICDATVGTPFLHPVLRRADPLERPDYVVHSYTKDLAGTGTTTAGVIIGRTETMFIPKNESAIGKRANGRPRTIQWHETLFWNVYYVKGAFLDSAKAFEVLHGMHTLEVRMLRKCINTIVLARVLASHPDINVHCSVIDGNENHLLREKHLRLGLPPPLFTIDLEGQGESLFDRVTFEKFFDSLEPAFGLQVSLGQVNTVVLCPALTSHSELPKQALRDAGITQTTIRISVGEEDPRSLISHFIRAAELVLDRKRPGFSKQFMHPNAIDRLYRETTIDVHARNIDDQPGMRTIMQ